MLCTRRFARLEHKVESLMKELEIKQQQQQQQTHPSDPFHVGQAVSQEPSPGSSSEHGRDVMLPTSSMLLNNDPYRSHMQPLQVSENDMGSCVVRYRAEMAPHFPFVAIPDIPPAKLYAERPFLFKAMAMVTSYKDRSFQHQFGTKLTEEVVNAC
ncbi:uncharacterized protein N7483_003723 [Penicillium malachiteum]|uniref:uncharacterized protein n=1 Tax=Penicillium malachiteum TaxID=1324776 RepID=UPI0025480D8A|nr:uncharacterized protein N7483_003723 [Penicillium malachiteum]KAJ5729215.1 hypothetical protein N7483_003723 [Penicillium malachiteum]